MPASALTSAAATWATSSSSSCSSSRVRLRGGRRGATLTRKSLTVGAISTTLPDSITKDKVPASLTSIQAPISEDLQKLNENLKNAVGGKHPLLMAAAEQIFGAGGKKVRPTLCLLVSRSTAHMMGLNDIRPQQRRLAEITEMIHVASLVHDDVLDETKMRRGKSTVNDMYGSRIAVLTGDYLFAQSSWGLANLDNLEVIKLISQVIADFANGEIKQAQALFDTEITFEDYMSKSFWKTASLIAASCKSSAIFSDVPPEIAVDIYNYGKHLGLAFQIVDDILDFTQSSATLGKEAGQDLASGNLTAPVLYALQDSSELKELIESEFQDDGSLERAIDIISTPGGGIDKAKELAREQGDLALAALSKLPSSAAKSALEEAVEYVLMRIN